jgi:hypothetical protein
MLLCVTLAILFARSTLAQIGVRTAAPVATNGKDVTLALFLDETQTCTKPITQGWFPTGHDPEKALCIWGQSGQEYLKYSRFASSAKSISATTEVLSDAFAGVRVALSTAVAATTSKDQTIDQANEPTPEQDRSLNLLAANGGNVAVTFSYPVYFKPIGKGSFVWNSYGRAGASLSALGGDAETTLKFGDLNGNIELTPLELRLDLLSFKENFNLLGYGRLSAIRGTRKFDTSIKHDHGMFLLNQIGAGLRVGKVLAIFVTWNHYSDRHIPGSGGSVTFVVGK